MRTPDSDSGTNITPYLRAANVGDGVLRLEDVKEMHFESAELDRHRLLPGDVLVTEASGSRDQVGQTALYSGEVPGVAMQNTLLRLRPRPGTEARYLYWWSRFAFGSGLYAEASQGLGIWHLGSERMQRLQVPVMPLEDQRRIADFLAEQVALLDRASELRSEHLRLGAERFVSLRRSLLDRLHHEHGQITLRHAVKCLDGQRIPLNAEQRAERKGDIPYWGAGSIVDCVDVALFSETLVLLGEDGAPFFDPYRDVAFAVREPVWVNNHIHALRPREGWDPDFLTHALNAVDYSAYITGATRDKLTQEDMRQIRLPLIREAEQATIAAQLNDEAAVIASLGRLLSDSRDLLRERKQALIMAAVNGDFDVTTARSVA